MDGKPKHDEPTADVYNQILALMEAGKIKGDPGADGFSPTVSVTETDEGTTVTFTDKDGEKVANIKNGKQGDKGDTGNDGFSPIANVTEDDSGVHIAITDKSGTTEATIAYLTDIQILGCMATANVLDAVSTADGDALTDENEDILIM